jgi:hypothetical protein
MAPILTPGTPWPASWPPTATTTWPRRSARSSRLAESCCVTATSPPPTCCNGWTAVPIEFIEALNAAVDVPDLAVILTAHPAVTTRRIERRGAHSRFEAGIATSRAEADLYRDATARLTELGWPLLTIDTTRTPIEQVTAAIAGRITQLASLPQGDSATA